MSNNAAAALPPPVGVPQTAAVKTPTQQNVEAAVAAAQRSIVYELEGRRNKPTLRVTVSGGEGSFLVPFDPFCRPDFDEWKSLIRNEMISRRIPASWFEPQQQHGSEEGAARGTTFTSQPFSLRDLTLTATIPQKDPQWTAAALASGNSPTKRPAAAPLSTFVEIDVEDNADLLVLCNTIKEQQQQQNTAGGVVDVGAYSVFITANVAPPLTEAQRYREDEEHQCAERSSILDSVVLPDFQDLQINLAHTPAKSQAAQDMIRVLRERE